MTFTVIDRVLAKPIAEGIKEEEEMREYPCASCKENLCEERTCETLQKWLADVTAAARMVEQMEVLAREGYRIELKWLDFAIFNGSKWFFGIYEKNDRRRLAIPENDCISTISSTDAVNKALTSLLSTLPAPQRSELAEKLGVEL